MGFTNNISEPSPHEFVIINQLTEPSTRQTWNYFIIPWTGMQRIQRLKRSDETPTVRLQKKLTLNFII